MQLGKNIVIDDSNLKSFEAIVASLLDKLDYYIAKINEFPVEIEFRDYSFILNSPDELGELIDSIREHIDAVKNAA